MKSVTWIVPNTFAISNQNNILIPKQGYNLASTRHILTLQKSGSILTFSNIAKSSQGAKLFDDLPLFCSFSLYALLFPSTLNLLLSHPISPIDHHVLGNLKSGMTQGQHGIKLIHPLFAFFFFNSQRLCHI